MKTKHITLLWLITITAAVVIIALAHAPVYADDVVIYYDGTSEGSTPLTLTQLFSNQGAYIKIDGNGDGTFDMKFSNWMKTGGWTPPSGATVAGFGSELSAGLQFATTNGWTVRSPATAFSNAFLFDAESMNPAFLNAAGTLTLTNAPSTPNTLPGFGFTGVTVAVDTMRVSAGGGVGAPPFVVDTKDPMLVSEVTQINTNVSGTVFGTSNGTASVREFRLTFTGSSGDNVPEPSSMAVSAIIAAIGFLRKRMFRRRG